MDVLCEAGQAIAITGASCYVKIGAQTGLKSVAFTNEGTGSERDLKLKLAISGLKYTQESKAAPGCTNGTFLNGSYSVSATVKATGTAGEWVGIWVE